MKCKNCNGVMQADEARRMYVCPYCDAQEPFDNLSRDEMQEIVDGAVEDVKIENKKMVDTIVRAHKQDLEEQEKTNEFANKGMTIMLVIFAGFIFIMMAFCFDTGYTAGGIIATIQFLMLVGSIICRGIASSKKDPKMSKIGTILMLMAAILILMWIGAMASDPGEDEESTSLRSSDDRVYDWPTVGIGSTLPHLDREHPDYSYSYNNKFTGHLDNVKKTDYDDYVQECIEAGFTYESVMKEKEYTAYDEKGNRLKVYYLSNTSQIQIEVIAALVMEDLYWPTQGVAKDVPAPESGKGYIETFSSDSFRVFVGDTTKEDFVKYIESCMNAGYEGRYEQNSDSFYGRKGDVKLSLEYRGNNIMYVIIYQ